MYALYRRRDLTGLETTINVSESSTENIVATLIFLHKQHVAIIVCGTIQKYLIFDCYLILAHELVSYLL